ncbi:MAG TPA: TOBE domain-containing protein [Azoarcus sp.]|nr:TOBE domain-containing protein [Azoarcus sp.]
MNKKVPERLLGRVSIEAEVGTAFSDTRIRLLEAVDQLGSISQAAKAVPLSYKAAWDAIDTMNNLASEPLVVRVTGGRQGGGTALTEYGRRVIALYRALEIETQTALERVGARLGEEEPIDVAGFRRLMHRMKMRSSARNQFSGPVVALRDGEVDFEVRLRIDDDTELAAVITRTSAENLGLAIGREVFAFVKAPSVLISTDAELRVTARNQLWGEITAIHHGSVNDEVTLTLPSGRSLAAVLTHESSENLSLAVGTRACAIFKASSVMLATYD